MSCQPSYGVGSPPQYKPNFVEGPDCEAPQFPEHRSRKEVGDAFFRSINQSPSENTISLELTSGGGNKTLTVRKYDSTKTTILDTETFVVTAGVDTPPCTVDEVGNLRSAVNHATTGSDYIEMTTLGYDIYDNRSTDDSCLTTFAESFMTGGNGGPTDGSSLDAIRTGPERTMIIISSTEDDTGDDVEPPSSKRIQQWDGTQWISYCNDVQGACPLEGTC